LRELLNKLRQPITPRLGVDLSKPAGQEPDFISSFKRDDYEAAVAAIKEYILAGDCMQVVISQRMSIPFRAAPIDLYRALRCINPTPYMYFFNFGDFHVVGSSPEVWYASRTTWSPCVRSPAPAHVARAKRPISSLSRICCPTPRRLPST